MPKDLFSTRSDLYALYRPSYPEELYSYILSFVPSRTTAWDCATGNGQAAKELAEYFKRVEATDISKTQLANAVIKTNIHYSVSPAEKTCFPDNYFDLVTIATAYHWLNWKEFRKEVFRVAKPGAVIAIWAYNLLRSDDNIINEIIDHFYHNVVGPYWNPERRFVDENYETVEFNYAELPPARWQMKIEFSKEHLLGFLESWSAVQAYTEKHKRNPLELIKHDLNQSWGNKNRVLFTFPLFLRLGKIVK